MIKSIKNKKAYTLLEMIVSLGIIAIIIVILFNSLIITMRISFKNLARSSVREEITTVVSEISDDINNADAVINCSGGSCEILQGGDTITWNVCSNRICRYVSTNGGNNNLEYQSAEDLVVGTLLFERGFVQNDNIFKTNILITVIGGHSNDALDINNVYRQSAASTRNYEF